MAYKKYCSIENSYREKFIQNAITQFPELLHVDYVLTEKLHGSHVALVFESSNKLTICSRNRILSDADKHYGIRNVLQNDLQDLATKFKQYSSSIDKAVTLHGEIFGPGIQKGVDYGATKQVRIFDMRIEDDLVPFKFMIDTFIDLDLSPLEYVVPNLGIISGLEAALNFDTEFDSHFTSVGVDNGSNICEGIVIKPYDKVYVLSNGPTFYLKKKNVKFSEKSKVAKPAKDRRSFSDTAHKLREEFLSLINENRVKSVFSKEGEIESPKEIGKYITLVVEDAITDIVKDYGEEFHALEKKERKYVLNVGQQIVRILHKYL
jgi:Rnl2 family RNA ligase